MGYIKLKLHSLLTTQLVTSSLCGSLIPNGISVLFQKQACKYHCRGFREINRTEAQLFGGLSLNLLCVGDKGLNSN